MSIESNRFAGDRTRFPKSEKRVRWKIVISGNGAEIW